MSDTIRIKGVVEYKVFQHKGYEKTLLADVKKDNLLVNSGKDLLIGLLYGPKTTFHISRMGFGISGDATTLTYPDLVNRYLNSVIAEKENEYTISFNWGLTLNEYNGNIIREFGLYSFGNQLFSRTLPAEPISKFNDISLNGVWKITFNAP